MMNALVACFLCGSMTTRVDRKVQMWLPLGSMGFMKIVHVASEFAPLVKVGGLGDVVHGLSRHLVKMGLDISVFIPAYGSIDRSSIENLTLIEEIAVSQSPIPLRGKVYRGRFDGIALFLFETVNPSPYFSGNRVYGEPNDSERFISFNLLVSEYLKRIEQKPELVHLHDWQTGLLASLLRSDHCIPTMLTLHNLQYQGYCQRALLDQFLPSSIHLEGKEDWINLIYEGIEATDYITTVSPTYAVEALSSPGGQGLEPVFLKRRDRFSGILNGIDESLWNPQEDEALPLNYGLENAFSIKRELKQLIQQDLGLKQGLYPLICSITRLTHQKGLHLIEHVLERAEQEGWQFILLGSSPDPEIQEKYIALSERFSHHESVRIRLSFDDLFARRLYGSSDMLIVPSLFEPCGLTQMIALRYGTVPIVRRTGGLNDTVADVSNGGNGFVFDHPTIQGIDWALNRALDLYKSDPKGWEQLVRRGMQSDFTWKRSAEQYHSLYQQIKKQA